MDWFNAIRAARFHYLQVAFPGASDVDVSFPAVSLGFFPSLAHFQRLVTELGGLGSAASLRAFCNYWSEVIVVGCRAHEQHLSPAPSLGNRVRVHAQNASRAYE